MLEPCSDCHFQDSLKDFDEEYGAIAERARRIEIRAWEAGYWMAASLGDLTEGEMALEPGERGSLDEAREKAIDTAVPIVFRNAELKQLARQTLQAAAEIDCTSTGCNLVQECPRVRYAAGMAARMMLLGKAVRDAER